MALVKYNDNSISAVTSTALAEGSLVPIKTLTASSSATLSFVHGTDGVVFDSTYPIYQFEFINCHADSSDAQFGFQVSVNGGSSYGVTITSTAIEVYHGGVQYNGGNDLAQSTNLQFITNTTYHLRAEESANGTLQLFNPSSTTFVKHWISRASRMNNTNFIEHLHAGYVNSTSSVNAIQFKMASGNISTGKIKLYGIKDS